MGELFFVTFWTYGDVGNTVGEPQARQEEFQFCVTDSRKQITQYWSHNYSQRLQHQQVSTTSQYIDRQKQFQATWKKLVDLEKKKSTSLKLKSMDLLYFVQLGI